MKIKRLAIQSQKRRKKELEKKLKRPVSSIAELAKRIHDNGRKYEENLKQ